MMMANNLAQEKILVGAEHKCSISFKKKYPKENMKLLQCRCRSDANARTEMSMSRSLNNHYQRLIVQYYLH